jgi:hypothetical protein
MAPPQCEILNHTFATCRVDRMPIYDSHQQHRKSAGEFDQPFELQHREGPWQENTQISTSCVSRTVRNRDSKEKGNYFETRIPYVALSWSRIIRAPAVGNSFRSFSIRPAILSNVWACFFALCRPHSLSHAFRVVVLTNQQILKHDAR